MKIVFIGTRGFPNVQGGVEKHCEELTKCLSQLGCDITVLTRAPYVNHTITTYNNVKLIHLPAIKNKFLEAYCHTFYGVIVARILNPDVLHIQAIGPGFFSLFARLLGLKVVLTSHGANYEHKKWGRFSRICLRFCEYMGMKFSNQVVAISQTIADEIKKKYKREVHVIPNGVIIPQIEGSCEALEKYGLEHGKYILSVGRCVEGKGFDELINSFGQFSSIGHRQKWKLVIAGAADHEDNHSRKLKKLAQQVPNVVLTGFLTSHSLAELYSRAGLFVLPSHYEGLPIVLLEAMSYGLNCVVSDIPANREVSLDVQRYFPPGNVSAMAQKIMQFSQIQLTHNEKLNQIEYVRAHFDWRTVAQRTLEVYQSI